MTSRRGTNQPDTATTAVWRQERLRFTGFACDRTRTGHLTCRVTLELGPGETIFGEASGTASPSGDARLGAEAALRALEAFTERQITFELIGVKVVRAFDMNVVIASIMQHGTAGPERLLGCYLAEGDHVRGAALAVMNATNRTLGTYILSH